MASTSLSIRGLDPRLKKALRLRGARHGRSMEAEARAILATALAAATRGPDTLLLNRLHKRT